MQFIPKVKLLEHHPDTLVNIRKEYNLDKPGAMQDAIRILREWIEKQEHFLKKNFSDHYLEMRIILCKGSIERAKGQLDTICTMRTLMPKFFTNCNVKTDLGELFDVVSMALLPTLTPDHYRVVFVKFNEKAYVLKGLLKYFSLLVILSEYITSHDYCRGIQVILDFTETNMTDILRNMNLVECKQVMSILMDGNCMRLKGMHIFTSSKLIETFTSILKQVTSKKIGGRIYSHGSLDYLPNLMPLDILPVEYGGKEKPLTTLREDWIEVLSSEENLDYLKDLSQAGTDESRRQENKFNEESAGLPGTFRLLSVD